MYSKNCIFEYEELEVYEQDNGHTYIIPLECTLYLIIKNWASNTSFRWVCISEPSTRLYRLLADN